MSHQISECVNEPDNNGLTWSLSTPQRNHQLFYLAWLKSKQVVLFRANEESLYNAALCVIVSMIVL